MGLNGKSLNGCFAVCGDKMDYEQEYLRLTDVELKLENSKRQLDSRLKAVRAEMEKAKDAIIQEYLEDGVVQFNLTIKKAPPKPIVTDESKIPDQFWKVERKLDKSALNKAVKEGEAFDGVAMDNGGFTVSIRAQNA